MRFVQKLNRDGNSVTLVLPRPLLHELKLQASDYVHVSVLNGKFLVTPLEPVLDELDRRESAVPSVTAPAPVG